MSSNLQELINQVKPYLRQYLIENGVQITKKGNTEFFCCIHPDHPDKNPSSGFVKGTGDQQMHCFSCTASGDIFTAANWLEKKPLHGLSFVKENLEYLLQRYDIEYKLEYTEEQLVGLKVDAIYEEAARLLTSIDSSTGKFRYLDVKPCLVRGWEESICKKIGIGCVTDYQTFASHVAKNVGLTLEDIQKHGIRKELFGPDRISITIRDHKSRVRGFVSRYLDWKKGSDIPKYYNTSIEDNPNYHKDSILFCLDLAKNYNSLRLDIFEGYGSAIVGHQNSYHNCAAIGSTAFTDKHIELIRQLGFSHINFVLDQDKTGYDMMEKYIERFGNYPGLEVTITNLPFTEKDLSVPGQNDPDYFIRTYGLDAYRKVKPEGLFEHMILKKKEFLNIDTNPAFTKNFVKQVIPLIINQVDMIERSVMINTLSELTKIDKDDIRQEITRLEKTDVRAIKEEIARKVRNTTNPDDLKDLLQKYSDTIQDAGVTKNDKYLSSISESIEVFDSIFVDMNTMPEGIHGWSTGFPMFDNMLDGIPKPIKGGVAIGFASAPQHGKQISDTTPVLTPAGWKKHGELKTGDYVYGKKGQPVKVLAIAPKLQQDCVVYFSDGETIECHENHEWVVSKNGKEKIIDTKSLLNVPLDNGRIGRKRRFIYSVDHNVAIRNTDKEFTIHPYVLGAWLGDGRSSASDLSHNSKDTEHINKIKLLGYSKTKEWTHKTTGVIYTSFKGLVKDLNKLGLKNNKHIPQEYLQGSINQRLELLAGLIDTDGYIYQKNGRMCFSNTNKRLIDDAAELVRSLGSRATIAKFKPRKGGSPNNIDITGVQCVYQLTFNLDLPLPTALPRKQWKGKTYLKRRRAIVKVERTTPVIGNCIQVEGGVYLVGKNLIPTHNSAIMLNLAVNLARNNDDIAVCYWAIDDHRKAIAYRLVSMISGVSMKKVRNTIKRTDEEDKLIREAQEIIRELTNSRKLIFKDDRYGRSKSKADAWLKETQDATGNHILFCVDSLHNVQGEGESETRVKILTTSTWLKSLCAKMPATIMTSIELVKNKTRGEKPTLMSISESGKVEFDFDTLAIVWNESQGCYLPVEAVSAKWGTPDNYKPIIELDFQKNKAGAGEKGSLFLKYDTETTAFVDCLSSQQYRAHTSGPSIVIGNSGKTYGFNHGMPQAPKETTWNDV